MLKGYWRAINKMSEISLKNLKKSFGSTQVIHDLSIDVKDGELIVIVGPSGCG